MLWAYLFILLCLCTTILLSPVIIRYKKDGAAALEIHFVFLSVSLSKKTGKKKATKKKHSTKGGERPSFRATLAVLHRAMSRCTVHLASAPLIQTSSPFGTAMLTGGYFFLISVFLSRFGQCTDDPLLRIKEKNTAPLDLRIKIRFCDFLYTFLVYLVQYKKEKETKSHGRNENERYYTNLS